MGSGVGDSACGVGNSVGGVGGSAGAVGGFAGGVGGLADGVGGSGCGVGASARTTWNCSACTTLNTAMANNCVVCAQPDNRKTRWVCPGCTYSNVATAETCAICVEQNPLRCPCGGDLASVVAPDGADRSQCGVCICHSYTYTKENNGHLPPPREKRAVAMVSGTDCAANEAMGLDGEMGGLEDTPSTPIKKRARKGIGGRRRPTTSPSNTRYGYSFPPHTRYPLVTFDCGQHRLYEKLHAWVKQAARRAGTLEAYRVLKNQTLVAVVLAETAGALQTASDLVCCWGFGQVTLTKHGNAVMSVVENWRSA